MNEPKIEVRANQLGDLPGLDPYYHLFIVYTDNKGVEYYLRGGPSGSPGSSRLSSELTGGSSGSSSNSNPSRSSDSSLAQPFGVIVTEYGRYRPGTIDWNPDAKSIVVERGSGSELAKVYEQLKAQMNAINEKRIRYNPVNQNSNSVVKTALENLGIKLQLPQDIWAPGSETHLIDQ